MASQSSSEDTQGSHGFRMLGDHPSCQNAAPPENEGPPPGIPLPPLGELVYHGLRADAGPGTSEAGGGPSSDPDEPFVSNPRLPNNIAVRLDLDGKNFKAWRVMVVAALDASPYALAVAKGTLLPPDAKTNPTDAEKLQQRKYDAGNRAARCILFGSLTTALAVSMFSDNADTVEAPEMWRDIIAKFTGTNGGLKQLAISKLMQYKYQQGRTASENLFRFNSILSQLATLGVPIPSDLKITVLLQSLPSSWEAFKQAFTARPEDSRDINSLLQAIQTEALRRGQFDTKEVTALFSRFSAGPSQERRRRFQKRRTNYRVTTSG